MVKRDKGRRIRSWFEWHEIKFEDYVMILSIAFFFFAVFLPTTIVMILLSISDYTIYYLIDFLFLAGLLYMVGVVRTFPNMIGLSDEKVILKYKKGEPREYHWGGISHIVFPKTGRGKVRIITQYGDAVSLRASRRIVKRLKVFWERSQTGENVL